MYILDTNLKKESIIYLIVTIACMIFSFIYLKLSFGVVSLYMKYVFLLPLILGFGVNSLLILINRIRVNRISNNLYNAGVATFIFGTIVRGILDICGGHSFLLWIYILLGILEIVCSFVITIIYNIKVYRIKKIDEIQ